MVIVNQCASREDLAKLLQGDAIKDDHPITLHVGKCPRCQQKLHSLVAEEADWEEGREMLLHANPPNRLFAFNDKFVKPTSAVSNIDEAAASKAFKDTWLDKAGHLSQGDMPAEKLEVENRSVKFGGDEPSRKIGNYEIVGTIGFGGMATVYQGIDRELNRIVAIKLLHEHLAVTGASRQRFLKEAQAAAAIVHPNVIPIYAIHLSEGRPYLAMPLISGGSLQQRIDRDGPLPLADILSIALQIAEALHAAHTKGVIHRDVKPANILLEDGNNRVILSDFGLARTLDDAGQTASGLISGTPAYMSPEQSRGESVDPRTDLYSLGCVIFAMATGHAPYEASSPLRLLKVVDESNFPDVHRYQEQLPSWLNKLVKCLVAREPERRTANAQEAAILIRDCLLHATNSQHPLPEQLTALHLTAKKSAGKFPFWDLKSFAPLLLFFLAVVFSYYRTDSDQQPGISNSSTISPGQSLHTMPGDIETNKYEPSFNNKTASPGIKNFPLRSNAPIEPSSLIPSPDERDQITSDVFEDINRLKTDLDRTLSHPIFQ